jgi:hypothetical protein
MDHVHFTMTLITYVRKCPSIRQISNDVFGHMNTSFSRPGDESYYGSYNPTWSQQSNLSWQAQFHGNPAPQFYDHSYSYPHQHYQEVPPPPKSSTLEGASAALEEASASLDRTMSTYLSQVEGDKRSFEGIKNSLMQSTKTMDAHFKQISYILREEECQGQLVANLNEYYMEDECTYYHEPHQEKQKSTKTSSTLALIPETQRGQEKSLLELSNEQIEDIKIEKLLEFSSYFIPIHESSLDEKLFEKT